MIRLLNKWLFVNYCGQKIGQFNGLDLKNSLLNVLVSQVAPFVNILIVMLYILIGLRNFYVLLIIMALMVYFTRIFLKKSLKEYLLMNKFETKYRSTSKKSRILNFVISILLTGGSVVIFGYSLSFLKWL